MKVKLLAAAIMSLSFPVTFAEAPATALSSDNDKLSYSIGIDLGKNFKRQNIDINPDAMAQGIKDAIKGNQFQLTEQQMQDSLNQFQKDFMAKKAAEFKKVSDANKTKGEAFLQDNKAKPGVTALPSGLQYKIITAGKGEKPGKDDVVTVEYTGRLINGEVFDSTDKAGKPATFKLSQVIPGWTEALQLMPVGSTWEIYVPSNLAYGERNISGPIGPNETLIFNIHLLSTKKGDAA